MKKYYIRFIIISGILFLINIYYTAIFCYIYSNSIDGWVNGAETGALLDWCLISLTIPLVKTVVRLTVRNCKYLRFLMVVEYSFFILNFIM